MLITFSAADIGEPVTQSLSVVMEEQAMKYWCWASVGAGISNYFNSSTVLSQIDVAAQILGDPACRAKPIPKACNTMKDIPEVLTSLSVPFEKRIGPTTWPGVVAAVDSKLPIIARIAWDNGMGHFLVLAGYDKTNRRAVVLDPKLGAHLVPFSGFPSEFRSGTRWTHSYVASAPMH